MQEFPLNENYLIYSIYMYIYVCTCVYMYLGVYTVTLELQTVMNLEDQQLVTFTSFSILKE